MSAGSGTSDKLDFSLRTRTIICKDNTVTWCTGFPLNWTKTKNPWLGFSKFQANFKVFLKHFSAVPSIHKLSFIWPEIFSTMPSTASLSKRLKLFKKVNAEDAALFHFPTNTLALPQTKCCNQSKKEGYAVGSFSKILWTFQDCLLKLQKCYHFPGFEILLSFSWFSRCSGNPPFRINFLVKQDADFLGYHFLCNFITFGETSFWRLP